jgi:AcrR family transcriptional regulator
MRRGAIAANASGGKLGASAAPGTLRPGGRTERVRQAVAEACLALLARGRIDLNPALVSEEAGVGRSTVHRRWPTRADLLREAHELHTRNLRVPNTGAFATDILQLARRLARFLSDPTEIAINSAMAAHSDPGFNDWQLDYWESRSAELEQLFQRALERAEISEDVDSRVLIEMLVGTMITRTAVMKKKLSAAFVRALAKQIIRAAACPQDAALPSNQRLS